MDVEQRGKKGSVVVCEVEWFGLGCGGALSAGGGAQGANQAVHTRSIQMELPLGGRLQDAFWVLGSRCMELVPHRRIPLVRMENG
uniref:Uncharacterized protein n=1 Tax=Knipowitschia caucasica TaxID=637954 RepID=A0AAV2KZM7_KNICA